MIKGSFWRKEITAPTDAGGIQLGVGNDYDLSTGEVNAPYDYSIYTNENLPSYAVMQFIDVNGKLVKSNKIPIETDGNGCVINSSYDETEEFDETHRMWNF